jgi:hypothetical protein
MMTLPPKNVLLRGLYRTFVGSVERSERNVSLDNIEKLAQALNVDITDLLADNSGAFQGRPIQNRGT